jgi:hypothetical protein
LKRLGLSITKQSIQNFIGEYLAQAGFKLKAWKKLAPGNHAIG